MKSIKINFILNFIYRFLSLVLAFFINIYASRILTADGIGIFSYTYSIVSYFNLFILLGINKYGVREISKVKDNKNKLSETFSSIYFIQFIMGIIVSIFYLFFTLIVKEYKIYFLIQILFIISTILDISWLYFGLEKYKLTIISTLICRFLSFILIFLFVKNINDLWIYTLISGILSIIIQIFLWVRIKKICKIVFVKFNDLKKHFIANLKLFIPVIAVSIYTIMDRIMLGKLCNTTEVGYYYNAEKIIEIPISLIGSLAVVLLPRISNYITNKENKKIKVHIEQSIKFVIFLSIPIFLILLLISKPAIILLYDSSFSKTSILINILAIIIPIKLVSAVIMNGYLIPKNYDNVYTKSVCIGAVINFILNLILIKLFNSIGASIATVFAEIFVLMYQLVFISKKTNIRKYLKQNISFIINGIIMFLILLIINIINFSIIFKIIINLILGIIIYFLLNYKYIRYILKLN